MDEKEQVQVLNIENAVLNREFGIDIFDSTDTGISAIFAISKYRNCANAEKCIEISILSYRKISKIPEYRLFLRYRNTGIQ